MVSRSTASYAGLATSCQTDREAECFTRCAFSSAVGQKEEGVKKKVKQSWIKKFIVAWGPVGGFSTEKALYRLKTWSSTTEIRVCIEPAELSLKNAQNLLSFHFNFMIPNCWNQTIIFSMSQYHGKEKQFKFCNTDLCCSFGTRTGSKSKVACLQGDLIKNLGLFRMKEYHGTIEIFSW